MQLVFMNDDRQVIKTVEVEANVQIWSVPAGATMVEIDLEA